MFIFIFHYLDKMNQYGSLKCINCGVSFVNELFTNLSLHLIITADSSIYYHETNICNMSSCEKQLI